MSRPAVATTVAMDTRQVGRLAEERKNPEAERICSQNKVFLISGYRPVRGFLNKYVAVI